MEMDSNQNLITSASAVPAGPPPNRAADFNIDKIMENYKKLVEREIDRVSAKFSRNPNPKDGAEALKLLNQIAETLLMHERLKARKKG
jgi:hypothetical protein